MKKSSRMEGSGRSPRSSQNRGDTGLISQVRPLRVGVTGGIGSGKSTVCKLFASMGRPVLSADDIARELTDTNYAIQSAIRKLFGISVFLPNGRVDRKALATVVFNDHSLRKELNAIIHPHVFSAIDQAIEKLDAAVHYVVIEAALIYEAGMDEQLDYVVVVNADEPTRITRVMSRDNVSREAVRARMNAQMDVEKKIKLADFVIENDGTEDDLASRVRFLDTLLSMMNLPKK